MSNSNSKSDLWFRRLRGMSTARFRLFCFPCAGAAAGTYHPWGSALSPDIEGFALQLPGRSDRLREAPVDDRAWLTGEMAEAIRPLLDRPFAFLGHSVGALLSFELARELRRREAPFPVRLFVAGRAAPQLPDPDPPLHKLPDREFIDELRLLGGIPDEVLAHAELLEVLLPAMRADIRLHELYAYTHEPPLERPITALGGCRDHKVPASDLQAWGQQTSSGFELHTFEGGHFFLHHERERIAALVRQALRGTHSITI